MYEVNHIYMSLQNMDEHTAVGTKDLSYLYKKIGGITNVHELHILLEQVSLEVVSEVNSYNKKNINEILQKAIMYIEANYTMSITLNELAEHTYVSTYYLSRMFKKELGKNFVEYLNEVRIEKAKLLLKDNKYKTYEVAELVGIQDPHYFSKIFKKYVNMTPTEYKDYKTD